MLQKQNSWLNLSFWMPFPIAAYFSPFLSKVGFCLFFSFYWLHCKQERSPVGLLKHERVKKYLGICNATRRIYSVFSFQRCCPPSSSFALLSLLQTGLGFSFFFFKPEGRRKRACGLYATRHQQLGGIIATCCGGAQYEQLCVLFPTALRIAVELGSVSKRPFLAGVGKQKKIC